MGSGSLESIYCVTPNYSLLQTQSYGKCHETSNKVTSKLECAGDKFQTRGWVRETPPTTSYARDLIRNAGSCSKLRDTCYTSIIALDASLPSGILADCDS
jgi:hypothetical protein